ncbi:MAG TPA: FG-GAP repeat protein [Gammaproteobacteria bacterium]|nr:FG-GAP repeat protein [Xanthomonadales bacterium]HPI96081.1 FG-GAP repeat protein [Gammaproteobacteria bacterium]
MKSKFLSIIYFFIFFQLGFAYGNPKLDSMLNAIKPDNIEASSWSDLKSAIFDYKIFADNVFGQPASISLDGNNGRAVIGAIGAQDNGFISGAAYVFELNNGQWSQVQKLVASDGVSYQFFGKSVAIDGNMIAVGSGGSSAIGAVYIFQLQGSQWIETDKLKLSSSTNLFSESIDLANNRLIVADRNAKNNTNPQIVTGAVYVYTYDSNNSTWSNPIKILANNPIEFSGFGSDLALDSSGNRFVVGANSEDNEFGADAGAVYVYDFNGISWSQSQRITANDAAAGDEFGDNVAIDGDIISVSGVLSKAYIFELAINNWFQSFLVIDGNPNSGLGFDLDMSNDKVVFARTNPKSLLVYKKNSTIWSLEETIFTPNSPQSLIVSLEGDEMLLGEYNIASQYYKFETDISCNSSPCWNHNQEFNIEDNTEEDAFGVSLDISGNRAVVGAFRDDDKGNNAGAAYVYEYKNIGNTSEWTLVKKLLATNGATEDEFGRSVAIDGDRIVIGAFKDDYIIFNGGIPVPVSNAGSVYVFEYDGFKWVETQNIRSGEGLLAQNDLFGFAVDIHGDRIAIGAYSDDENGINSGAVYIYQAVNNNWELSEKIMPNDGDPDDSFGYAISLDSSRILIGAYQDDDIANNAGAAYIYQYNPVFQGWNFQDKLLPLTFGNPDDFVGTAVSLQGDKAIVGANWDNVGQHLDNGRVYYYKKDELQTSWSQIQSIVSQNSSDGDRFGYSVSIHGKKLLVGAWREDHDTKVDNGAAYLLSLNETTGLWEHDELLRANDFDTEDYFGVSVKLTDQWMMIGAHQEDTPSINAGSVYVYRTDLIFENGFE